MSDMGGISTGVEHVWVSYTNSYPQCVKWEVPKAPAEWLIHIGESLPGAEEGKSHKRGPDVLKVPL